jgi:hypothetical protein
VRVINRGVMPIFRTGRRVEVLNLCEAGEERETGILARPFLY